jgi:hypothetical protein
VPEVGRTRDEVAQGTSNVKHAPRNRALRMLGVSVLARRAFAPAALPGPLFVLRPVVRLLSRVKVKPETVLPASTMKQGDAYANLVHVGRAQLVLAVWSARCCRCSSERTCSYRA